MGKRAYSAMYLRASPGLVILRALIALSALQQPGERLKEIGKAFKDPLRSLGAISGYIAGRAKRQLTKPEFTKVHPAFRDEAEQLSDVIHNLALGVEGVLMSEGKKIIEKQFHQERLANAAIDIYLAVCALSRATVALEAAGGDEAKAAPDVDCARLFVSAATRRARRAVRGLSRNQDERQKAVAERALESAQLCPEVGLG